MTTTLFAKRFEEWHELKRKVDAHSGTTAYCKPRDVWWVCLGHNVGYEQDGKGENFERPVLVVKVFSNNLFFGIPLTSQNRKGDYYYDLEYNGVPSVAILSQARAFSQKRILNKVGVVPIDMFNDLKEKYKKSVFDL